MKKKLLLIFFSFSLNAMATPQKIEMLFLSPSKVTELMELIEKNSINHSSGFVSQNDESYLDNCVPMGEGCFHPQYGYLNRKAVLNSVTTNLKEPITQSEATSAGPSLAKDPDLQLKTFNAVETSMINCDKGNYFDIFCGKEKAAGKPTDIEIWFDVSSSLRAVDYSKDPDRCNRRTFMTKVKEGCKDKVQVSIYNTSLKEVGDSASVCLSYGTNDESKLLQWLKASEAKTLLVITDIDEMSQAMREFLEIHGAKMIGDGVKAFTSADLVNYANDFVKTCKK